MLNPADPTVALVTEALAQAGLAHGPLRLVSTTNHAVLTDGHAHFKTPLPNSPSRTAIAIEAAVLEHLGLLPAATITTSDGAPVLITPTAGAPARQVTADMVVDVTGQLGEIHAQRVPPALVHRLPTMDQVIETLHKRTQHRLEQASLSLPTRVLVTDWIEHSLHHLAGTAPDGTSLLHGDPHPGNWVLGTDGRPVLLDWESARIGPPEWDLAALAHSFLLTGQEDLWSHALAAFGAVNVEAFTWAFQAKATTATSWAAWQLGDEGVAHRETVIWPLVRDPLPLLDFAPVAARTS